MGEYDLVKQVLSTLGDVELWKVAMQPAKPFAFGHIAGTPLFGLPGNPVSALVAFEQFVRPSLLKMMGARTLYRRRVPAVAGHLLRTNSGKNRVRSGGGGHGERPTGRPLIGWTGVQRTFGRGGGRWHGGGSERRGCDSGRGVGGRRAFAVSGVPHRGGGAG